jgi:DNA polymerase-3 subunit epsilon
MVDTVALARKKHPGAKLSLDALCTRYGIDRSHRVKHGALLDAELLAQVYVELTGGRQIGLGLAPADTAVNTAPQSGTNAPWHRPAVSKPRREPRPHVASPDELERHRAFVAGIANAIWIG